MDNFKLSLLIANIYIGFSFVTNNFIDRIALLVVGALWIIGSLFSKH